MGDLTDFSGRRFWVKNKLSSGCSCSHPRNWWDNEYLCSISSSLHPCDGFRTDQTRRAEKSPNCTQASPNSLARHFGKNKALEDLVSDIWDHGFLSLSSSWRRGWKSSNWQQKLQRRYDADTEMTNFRLSSPWRGLDKALIIHQMNKINNVHPTQHYKVHITVNIYHDKPSDIKTKEQTRLLLTDSSSFDYGTSPTTCRDLDSF